MDSGPFIAAKGPGLEKLTGKMKRIAILIAALLIGVTAFAQVGRYKNLNLLFPGYSLKLDTATGELWAVHYDDDAEVNIEEQILEKQSHNHKQVGRYELRRTKKIGTFQVFDTSSGNYVTVKWKPKDKDGVEIDQSIENTILNVVDHLRDALDSVKTSIVESREEEETEI